MLLMSGFLFVLLRGASHFLDGVEWPFECASPARISFSKPDISIVLLSFSGLFFVVFCAPSEMAMCFSVPSLLTFLLFIHKVVPSASFYAKSQRAGIPSQSRHFSEVASQLHSSSSLEWLNS